MRATLFLLFFAPITALAGWGDRDIEFDSEKPWVELQAQLPPYPKLDEAISFAVSGPAENDFSIDPKSINVGKDDVVRYTLIVKSPEGSLNVTFEGISCRSKELKIYAFGRADGNWSQNRHAKWSPIEHKARNRHHHVLYQDFFCPEGLVVKDVAEAIFALKRGNHPRAR